MPNQMKERVLMEVWFVLHVFARHLQCPNRELVLLALRSDGLLVAHKVVSVMSYESRRYHGPSINASICLTRGLQKP